MVNTAVTISFLEQKPKTKIRWADEDVWIVASMWHECERQWVVWPPVGLEHIAFERYGDRHPMFKTSDEAFGAFRLLIDIAPDYMTTLQINDRTTT
jgi:hypothetical protein